MVIDGSSASISLIQGSGNITEEGAGRMSELEYEEESGWTLSSRQDMAVMLMDSPQLGLPAHSQAVQTSRMGERGAPEAPPWAVGLLAAGICWKRENHFSLEMWPLVGCPSPRGWPQTHVHMISTNWTQGVISDNNNFRGGHEVKLVGPSREVDGGIGDG